VVLGGRALRCLACSESPSQKKQRPNLRLQVPTFYCSCVFYSLPTEVLSGGFAEGRMYERGLILWIREQSEYCQDLNYNNGGGGRTPKDQGRGEVRGGRRDSPPARRKWCRREPRREASGPRLGPQDWVHHSVQH
jgi:hypothetical protein